MCQTVVGGGSFCAETSPAQLTSCQTSTIATGAISRYQPRPGRPRPARGGRPSRDAGAGRWPGGGRGRSWPDGSGRAGSGGRDQGGVSDFRHVIPRRKRSVTACEHCCPADGGSAMRRAGRRTDRAGLHAEVGIPARHERFRVTHPATVGNIVYKVNRFSRKMLSSVDVTALPLVPAHQRRRPRHRRRRPRRGHRLGRRRSGPPRSATWARSPAAPSSSASRRPSPRPAPGARTRGWPPAC